MSTSRPTTQSRGKTTPASSGGSYRAEEKTEPETVLPGADQTALSGSDADARREIARPGIDKQPHMDLIRWMDTTAKTGTLSRAEAEVLAEHPHIYVVRSLAASVHRDALGDEYHAKLLRHPDATVRLNYIQNNRDVQNQTLIELSVRDADWYVREGALKELSGRGQPLTQLDLDRYAKPVVRIEG